MNEEQNDLLNDADLLRRAQTGDLEAFGELYERYFDPIFRYIRSRVGEERTAEDLTEEVFLRSFEALDRYRDRGLPFSTYLYRIARNIVIDAYRKRTEEVPIEDVAFLPATSLNPDASLIKAERTETLMKALAKLPDDYLEVIRLRVILELPTETVSQWMNRSEGAIRVLLHRALKSLQETWAEVDE